MDAKAQLREALTLAVAHARDTMRAAQRATEEAATHPEAKPENDKDTRALEQSYLARGQAERLAELENAVVAVTQMPLPDAPTVVGLGVVVVLRDDAGERRVFIAPGGGGLRLRWMRGRQAEDVDVVTPVSPLGRALWGRSAGEVAEVALGGKAREIEIEEIL